MNRLTASLLRGIKVYHKTEEVFYLFISLFFFVLVIHLKTTPIMHNGKIEGFHFVLA
uniref:Uncharacterized protein n=1 Tax=Octopus bimaculoides TaxID=37653 RepID=A0A0L8FZP3_OCTBM